MINAKPISCNDLLMNSHGTYQIRRENVAFQKVELEGDIEATNQHDAAREAYAAMLVAERCTKVWVGKAAQRLLYPQGRPEGTKDCDVIGRVGTGETFIIAEGKGTNDMLHALRDQFPAAAAKLPYIHYAFLVTPLPLLLRFGREQKSTSEYWLDDRCCTERSKDITRVNGSLTNNRLDPNIIYINQPDLLDVQYHLPAWGFKAQQSPKVLYTHDTQPLSGQRGKLRQYRINASAAVEIVFVAVV